MQLVSCSLYSLFVFMGTSVCFNRRLIYMWVVYRGFGARMVCFKHDI